MVLPAPDGPTSATVLPAGTMNDTSASASRGRPGYVKRHALHLERRRPAATRRASTPGPSVTGHRLGVHRVDAARGAQRVGELAADLRDLPHAARTRTSRAASGAAACRRRAVRSPRATRPRRRPPDRRARSPSPAARSARQVVEERHARSREVLRRLRARTPRPRARTRWNATISPRPCTESTACAFRSPDDLARPRAQAIDARARRARASSAA